MKGQKGITLIALIVTIIVMLILVTVSVTTLINSGLFKHAGDATEGWQNAEKNEMNYDKEVKVNTGEQEVQGIDEIVNAYNHAPAAN